MEEWGKRWKWWWIPVLPLHRKGAVGDGWAHKSRAPQCWQRLCHSSTPTSQLQSSDCAWEHISGEILPLSAWKHNHTHAKTGSMWHLSGFAFLLAVHTLGFSWTGRNSLRLNYFFFFFLNFPSPLAMWVGSWQTGSFEFVHKQIFRHSTSAKVYRFPFMHPLFCHLAFITIYLTFLLSGEILLYIFHIHNQKPSQ